MSAVTRPRGPLPARVYWTRRAILVGLALLLVVGLGRMIGGGSDGADEPGLTARPAAGTPTADAGGPVRTAGPEAGERRKPARKKARPPKPAPAEPDGPCAPEELTVTPVIDEAFADDAIRVRFEVSTTRAACTWTAGPDSLAVKISSGDDLIWTSQHCPDVLPTKDLVVRAEKPARLAMTWNGRRSEEDCERFTEWALPGYYHVVAAALGGEPTDRQFELRRPRRETVTRTVAPKPKPKKKRDAGHGAGDGHRAPGEHRPTEEPLDDRRDGSQEPDARG